MAIRKINSRSLDDDAIATADIADGSISTAKLADGSISTVKLADDAVTTPKVAGTVNLGRRNLFINGAMQVWQRGTTFSAVGVNDFVMDRFKVLAGGAASGNIDVSRSTDAPAGFRSSAKFDVQTAIASLASNDYYLVQYAGWEQQDIDHLNFGTSDAKQLTLSFWVKSNKTGTLFAELQYTATEASGSSVELGKPYTIDSANTWEYKTITFDAPTGFTSNQTSANGSGLWFYMWIAAGTNWATAPLDTTWGVNTNRVTGQDNYLDSTSNEIYITGMQLEVGDTATPFEHQSYGDEFQRCQRYYQRTHNTHYSSGSFGGQVMDYPVFMRATPTVTDTGLAAGLTSTLHTNRGANGASLYYFYHNTSGYCTAVLDHDAEL